MALERPPGPAVDDLAAGGGVAGDARLQHVEVVYASGGEALLGLAGADAGLADQDDFAVEPGGQLGGVLADEVEGQVV